MDIPGRCVAAHAIMASPGGSAPSASWTTGWQRRVTPGRRLSEAGKQSVGALSVIYCVTHHEAELHTKKMQGFWNGSPVELFMHDMILYFFWFGYFWNYKPEVIIQVMGVMVLVTMAWRENHRINEKHQVDWEARGPTVCHFIDLQPNQEQTTEYL